MEKTADAALGGILAADLADAADETADAKADAAKNIVLREAVRKTSAEQDRGDLARFNDREVIFLAHRRGILQHAQESAKKTDRDIDLDADGEVGRWATSLRYSIGLADECRRILAE